MKFVRFLGFLWFLFPCLSFAAGSSDFQMASELLSAARRGDTQTVQVLINRGANINYVDSTGLSLVCTAVMNNDKRTIQILQMYGADASNCDRQIKKYRQRTTVAASGEEYGFFSGLSSTHVLLLSGVGVAAVIGGVVLLSKVFDKDGGGSSSGETGDRPNNNNQSGNGNTSDPNKLFAQNIPNGPGCNGDNCSEDFTVWQEQQDFNFLSSGTNFNYLMVSRAYNAFVRGYQGWRILRAASDLSPVDLKSLYPYTFASLPGGGKPVNVAMITSSGVNATEGTSAVDGLIPWIDSSKISLIQSACANGTSTTACQNAWTNAIKTSHKYFNYSGDDVATGENTDFNFSGTGSVFGNATDADTKLAKIIAGWEEGGRENTDYYGFVPDGQLTVYKIGSGEADVSDYKNYSAIYDALQLQSSGEYVANVVANLSLTGAAENLSYATVDDSKILYNTASTDALKKSRYLGTIDNYYNLNTGDDATVNKPSIDADYALTHLGNYQKQIWVNPVGHTLYGLGDGKSLTPQVATFENFAPVVYNNLQNLFASVVAVRPASGTSDFENIESYSSASAGTLVLSTWQDSTDTSVYYQSRICGLAGNGNDGAMNPWCFAAPGNTDLEATAAMAGSIALVKSAFDYMSSKEIFLLLALTADGPYLGTNPNTDSVWASVADLRTYLKDRYTLPANLDTSDSGYFESFKTAFGYGMINLERATKPGTNIYYFSSDKNAIVSSAGNSYWRKATTTSSSSRASTVLSLTNRQSIRTSFFDVIESADGTLSLPRVWNTTIASGDDYRHGLYMGDVLGEFNVAATNKQTREIGRFSFDMSVSPRAYNDNMNGLDNLRVAFSNEKYDIDAEYQHYLTNGESRFNGRANGVLALVSNAIDSGAKYKMGNFAFGTRVFSGDITNENLLENDPVVSSQFEPGRLGFANGAAIDSEYNNDKFGLNVSFGNMQESNTLFGVYGDGLLSINGADTRYVDMVATYNPLESTKLFARATFADTSADVRGGMISYMSDIKSNAFAIGLDMGRFSLTASMPLAVVSGRMGYDYAEYDVVENDGKYEIAVNNPHVEYIDLASQKRELRYTGSYKTPLGEFTDAGFGFIYRVNPNNTDAFGNETILMFKLHHRLGI